MPDENKIRDAADAIKGVVEAVPVYQDVVQPAAKELGIALQKITKTIHIALSPLYALVWGHEKISAYLDETLAEKLKHVPEENIVPPSPSIAGPTLEALRFAGHEPTLRELYANLLSTSMDARTADQAHPAFVDIIRQLSSDEARVLRYLALSYHAGCMVLYGSCCFVAKQTVSDELSDDSPCRAIDASNTLAIAAACDRPYLIQSYFDNVRRLGLVSIEEAAGDTGPDWSILEMEGEEYIWGTIRRWIQENELAEPPVVYFQGTTDIVRFTAFGNQFCNSCIFEDTHLLDDTA